MQHFTIRPVVLTHKANKQNMVTIRIAVTVNRKVTYLATTHRIHVNQWSAEKNLVINHENAGVINVALRRRVADIERDLINNSMHGVQLSKRVIKGQVDSNRLFYDYAKEVREDETELNRLKAYGGDQLFLHDINVQFLRRYEQHERARGMMPNTLNSTFKYLGRIMNQAHREKLIKENPFNEYQVPRYKQTDRVYLLEPELKKIFELLPDLPPNLYRTACYFLLACYSGLRHGDWKRVTTEMVEGDFLKLRAQKNGVHVVLPVGVTLTKVLAMVKELPPPYTNEKCNEMLKSIAVLAGIKKNLTTHVGRHTFGYMCAANGLPESTTAALLGVTANVVKVYYHLSGQNIIDQAAALKTI